jgi:imidazole glycerol-phosphate synthase subunit HisH
MKTVIIQYNAGNTESVKLALQRIGVNAIVSDDRNLIQQADRIIFPGVGHAQAAMQHLKEKKLAELIKQLKQPVLGICLGQQLMCRFSEEGDTDCIGIFDEQVKRFQVAPLKVPLVGWHQIYKPSSLLFKNVPEGSFVYGVHSYYCTVGVHTAATGFYGQVYSAALQYNNFYAVQFHPEKSGKVGEQILNNFIFQS